MNSHTNKKGGLFFCLLVLGAMGLVLRYPREIQYSAFSTLLLCGKTVIPSIFPFLVLSGLFVARGGSQLLAPLFAPITKLLFRLPASAATPFLLGILSGYPVGASAVGELYRQGGCSRSAAQRMLPFCNNSGPAFVVGAVGVGMLGNAKLGWLLYGVHIAAALSCGMVFSCFGKEERAHPCPPKQITESFAASLVRVLKSSTLTMVHICGFLVFFGALMGLLQGSGALAALCSLLGAWLPLPADLLPPLCNGMLELTTGLSAASSFGSSLQVLLLMEMILSFGGLCVHCQVAGVVDGLGLDLRPYVWGKVLQSALSGLLLYLVLLSSPSILETFAPVQPEQLLSHPFLLLFGYVGAFFLLALPLYGLAWLLDRFRPV